MLRRASSSLTMSIRFCKPLDSGYFAKKLRQSGAATRAEKSSPSLFRACWYRFEARALVGSSAKLLHRLAHVAERDEVAELHASGEDDHRQALVFSDVRLAELLRAESCLEEVLVIEDRVRDSSFGE